MDFVSRFCVFRGHVTVMAAGGDIVMAGGSKVVLVVAH